MDLNIKEVWRKISCEILQYGSYGFTEDIELQISTWLWLSVGDWKPVIVLQPNISQKIIIVEIK